MPDDACICDEHAPPADPHVVAGRFPAGFRGAWHSHWRAQLIYPSQGVMTLHTAEGAWVAPPLRGCWLQAGAAHRVETRTGIVMHSVYFARPDAALPDRCGVVPVSALMRELILALEREPAGSDARAAMGALLTRRIALQPQAPLFLPRVRSPALERIAAALAADPADGRTLADWSRTLGATTRTLARRFRRETGMSFVEFRRQLRLHAAIEGLAAGHPVTAVAYDVGFSSPANFATAFRRATGSPPSRYFAQPAD